MRFSGAAILLSIVALAAAAPTGVKSKRALTVKSYAEFQVSDGVAGNALAEVNANFPVSFVPAKGSRNAHMICQVDTSDLAGVSASDLKIIQDARLTAEDAEVGTGGFNDEIAAASGDTTALQNGKIKNKVLKLQLEVLGLQIQQAQGADNQDKIDEETNKLNKNIALDTEAKGQKSVGVTSTFSG
jgi:hypothetical protein